MRVIRILFLTILAIVGGCSFIAYWHNTNRPEDERLADLIHGIEMNGSPKHEQGIEELRAYLTSTNPQVRYDAARMLYEMKDRSGYETLLNILRSPEPVPGKSYVDLRYFAADTFARYREHRAGEALLSQYERTKLVDLKRPALTLRLKGMVLYLHESFKQRMWVDSIEGLAVLDPHYSQPLFKRIADDDRMDREYRAAAIFGLAMGGDEAALERLIAMDLLTYRKGEHLAQMNAATYLTYFRGERVVKVFEEMLKWEEKQYSPSIALAYLRYRHPQNKPSREIIKAGLQPGGAKLGWSYELLLKLALLSGDPELLALGHKTDYFTSFRELDVRAGWSNAWIEQLLPDWEGDWPD